MRYTVSLFCTLFFFVFSSSAFQLTRVILAVNDNPDYIHFWPIAAKAWKEIVGVQPTLALIASKDVEVDETVGDVIRFEPIPGVSTVLYAQCIRLLLPCLFPNDGCILADIDSIPLQESFFKRKVQKYSDDYFVTYRDRAYWFWIRRVFMCYNAATGKTFQDVFQLTDINEIPKRIQEWSQLKWGFSTDEYLLYKYLKKWHKRTKRWKCLGYDRMKKRRIHRDLRFKERTLLKSRYLEMNCPRPYSSNKNKIDYITSLALLAHMKKNAS